MEPFFYGKDNYDQLVKIAKVLGTTDLVSYLEKYDLSLDSHYDGIMGKYTFCRRGFGVYSFDYPIFPFCTSHISQYRFLCFADVQRSLFANLLLRKTGICAAIRCWIFWNVCCVTIPWSVWPHVRLWIIPILSPSNLYQWVYAKIVFDNELILKNVSTFFYNHYPWALITKYGLYWPWQILYL